MATVLHLHVKASVRTYCIVSAVIISYSKGKGNAAEGGRICAGDFPFLHSISERRQDNFIQQPMEHGGQDQRARESEEEPFTSFTVQRRRTQFSLHIFENVLSTL